MQFDITALTGQNVNGIPILSNRTIEQVVRLRANETSILSGLIETSEIRSITGWPGLTFLGPLTSDRSKQQSDTELVIAITPRQLRLTPRSGSNFLCGPRCRHGRPAGTRPGLPQPPAAAGRTGPLRVQVRRLHRERPRHRNRGLLRGKRLRPAIRRKILASAPRPNAPAQPNAFRRTATKQVSPNRQRLSWCATASPRSLTLRHRARAPADRCAAPLPRRSR